MEDIKERRERKFSDDSCGAMALLRYRRFNSAVPSIAFIFCLMAISGQ